MNNSEYYKQGYNDAMTKLAANLTPLDGDEYAAYVKERETADKYKNYGLGVSLGSLGASLYGLRRANRLSNIRATLDEFGLSPLFNTNPWKDKRFLAAAGLSAAGLVGAHVLNNKVKKHINAAGHMDPFIQSNPALMKQLDTGDEMKAHFTVLDTPTSTKYLNRGVVNPNWKPVFADTPID